MFLKKSNLLNVILRGNLSFNWNSLQKQIYNGNGWRECQLTMQTWYDWHLSLWKNVENNNIWFPFIFRQHSHGNKRYRYPTHSYGVSILLTVEQVLHKVSENQFMSIVFVCFFWPADGKYWMHFKNLYVYMKKKHILRNRSLFLSLCIALIAFLHWLANSCEVSHHF